MENENGILENLNQDDTTVDNVEGQDTKVVEDQKYLNQKIRAEKAEKALAELMRQKKEQETVTAKPVDASLSRLDEVEQKVELRMSGFSKDEIEFADRLAKGSGKKLIEIINDSYFKKAIEGSRAEKQADSNTPTPSNRTAIYKGKTMNEVVTDPKASKEDKQAAFNALMASKKGVNKFN